MTDENPVIFCQSGGCAAKLGPGVLSRVLDRLPRPTDPNLLVGFEGSDDAAVYRLTDDLALVSTLDFFPPMVDDPYTFGQIAATNALSDVYAMGGDVLTALNIVAFPDQWDLNILGEILRGGSDKVREAGASLAGGHSITDDVVKYGLSVTGRVDPRKIWRNTGCQPGDCLILTKALGVGIVLTAQRHKAASEATFAQAIQSMTTLNRQAAQLLHQYTVHSCTDVTGFGLLGHLLETLGATSSAILDFNNIPIIQDALIYAEQGLVTGASARNRQHVGDRVVFDQVSPAGQEILFDPQTSGGLLVSVPEAEAQAACRDLQGLGLPCQVIGQVIERREPAISVRIGGKP